MRDDTPTVEAEAALSWHERDRDDPERWGVDEAEAERRRRHAAWRDE
jgi:hypothetical protein